MYIVIGGLIALLIICIVELVKIITKYERLHSECHKAVSKYDNFRNNLEAPPQLHREFIGAIRKYVL